MTLLLAVLAYYTLTWHTTYFHTVLPKYKEIEAFIYMLFYFYLSVVYALSGKAVLS